MMIKCTFRTCLVGDRLSLETFLVCGEGDQFELAAGSVFKPPPTLRLLCRNIRPAACYNTCLKVHRATHHSLSVLLSFFSLSAAEASVSYFEFAALKHGEDQGHQARPPSQELFPRRPRHRPPGNCRSRAVIAVLRAKIQFLGRAPQCSSTHGLPHRPGLLAKFRHLQPGALVPPERRQPTRLPPAEKV
jgi:hypothetical protein